MRIKTQLSILLAAVATVALAGPPLGCVQFSAVPGSLFEKVAPLARVMIESDDNEARGKFAQAKIASLRAAAIAAPKNLVAQLEAGYLIQAMNQVSHKKDPDGLRFLKQALALDPSNAELHIILALAYKGEDEAKSKHHVTEALRLMKPGSAAEKNFVSAKLHLGIS
jgi:hypothetical protein